VPYRGLCSVCYAISNDLPASDQSHISTTVSVEPSIAPTIFDPPSTPDVLPSVLHSTTSSLPSDELDLIMEPFFYDTYTFPCGYEGCYTTKSMRRTFAMFDS